MNQLILKRTALFSLILGAIIGLISIIPPIIGFCLFILSFFSGAIVILYMKKDEKHIAYLTNEQAAIVGGVIGFFTTLGFFVTFSPMVCILKLIFKNYYSYMIPDMLSNALWLFFVIVFMVAVIFAMTNSALAMGIIWLINKIEGKPQHHDAGLDIKIED